MFDLKILSSLWVLFERYIRLRCLGYGAILYVGLFKLGFVIFMYMFHFRLFLNRRFRFGRT